ncbi:MAG TPA: XTP/dITP diphosphatase [Oscillospiraceae bacterium]|nr:XTP/dITP diphosphatase [Oscillospiraceae bacterium]
MEVIAATNNANKLRELSEILQPLGFTVLSLTQAGIMSEPLEDGETFEENARIKAMAVREITGKAVIADDSGLEVDFLNGAPGVYSARYAGIGASDSKCNDKLLSELEGIEQELRSARFVCALYMITCDGDELCFRGECNGYIGTQLIGENGFGYDPLFMLDEDTSMATISTEEKNKISHRAIAIGKLAQALREGVC